MLIEQVHFVHPNDVDLSGQVRDPEREGAEDLGPDDMHPNYVDLQRAQLQQDLVGQYDSLVYQDSAERTRRFAELRSQGVSYEEAQAKLPPRWLDRGEPEVRELTESYTDTNGQTWQLPYVHAGVRYDIGWIGLLEVTENPNWAP